MNISIYSIYMNICQYIHISIYSHIYSIYTYIQYINIFISYINIYPYIKIFIQYIKIHTIYECMNILNNKYFTCYMKKYFIFHILKYGHLLFIFLETQSVLFPSIISVFGLVVINLFYFDVLNRC